MTDLLTQMFEELGFTVVDCTPEEEKMSQDDTLDEILSKYWGSMSGILVDAWENPKDEAKAAITKLIDEKIESAMIAYQKELLADYERDIAAARIEELEYLGNDIAGIGSRGDKVNGNKHYMLGVQTVEKVIKYRIAKLDTRIADTTGSPGDAQEGTAE